VRLRFHISLCISDNVANSFCVINYLESTFAAYTAKSISLFKYPHSLSYQAASLTNLSLSCIPAIASKIQVLLSPIKSAETTASSVYPRRPFNTLML